MCCLIKAESGTVEFAFSTTSLRAKLNQQTLLSELALNLPGISFNYTIINRGLNGGRIAPFPPQHYLTLNGHRSQNCAFHLSTSVIKERCHLHQRKRVHLAWKKDNAPKRPYFLIVRNYYGKLAFALLHP
ncbi:hypothetical protein TNCT_153341 [Trichonephila clavata]|uniref:Uncharacterized protein n=1 Tax=Trichonephila clavata TaxID=2740835 RepID=A0A8X6LZ14_TRICU|nr:hypothetical protein TNCT_153341 [Trichonephila clavata]